MRCRLRWWRRWRRGCIPRGGPRRLRLRGGFGRREGAGIGAAAGAVLVKSAFPAAMLAGACVCVAWAAGPLPEVGVFGDAARGGGFAQVLEPRGFEFPRDHGPHPEYRQEWWYVTGNLDSTGGERF